jgi:hypothetical protein
MRRSMYSNKQVSEGVSVEVEREDRMDRDRYEGKEGS